MHTLIIVRQYYSIIILRIIYFYDGKGNQSNLRFGENGKVSFW